MITGATRTKLGAAGEFLVAAAFLAATVVVALLVFGQLRVAPGPAATTGSGDATQAEAVPAGAVSIPALALGQATEIRVGDEVEGALARLGAEVKLIQRTSSRGLFGPREIRSYDLAGTKFTLVLEPLERGGTPRVAAIYMQ